MKNTVKKLLITFSVAALAVVGFAGCKPDKPGPGPDPTPPAHVHTYTDWECNATHHWRTVVCDKHDATHEVQDGYGTHSYENGVCRVCGYDQVLGERVEFIYKVVTGGYSVSATSYGKTKATLTVPAQKSDLDVVAVEAFAFEDAQATAITLPDTITSIGREAFSGCVNLKEMDLSGYTFTTIENAMFLNCSALTEITLPTSVTTVKPGAFEGCSALKEITLPSGLTSLGEQAFGRCSALETITLPSGITLISHNTFQGCSKLATVTMEGDVDYIGDNAFAHCTALETIDLGSKMWYIGQKAFYESGLTEVSIPGNVSYLAAGAFANCEALKTVTMESGKLVRIYGELFSGCSALEELTLAFVGSHRDVTTPTEGSFSTVFGFIFGTAVPKAASKFTKAGDYYVPNSLKIVTVLGGTISEGAFDGCSMLEQIIARGATVNATEFTNCPASVMQG